MASQKTRNKRLQFDKKTQQIIWERDRACIFCIQNYHLPADDDYAKSIYDIAHYINKSAGGLGIPQNGVLSCRYHHMLLDNGNRGLRKEMLTIMEDHLKSHYPDWCEEDLYYKKYDF